MRMIKLGIYLKNRQHAKDIARALADMETNLEISLLEGRLYQRASEVGRYDIILSDRSEFRTYEPKALVFTDNVNFEFDEKYEKEGQTLSAFAAADEIFAALLRIFERNNHKLFMGNNNYSCKTIIFSSKAGGSGTSAAAITCGRLLASEHGKKVLYLNAGGSESWKLYISDLPKPHRPAGEIPHLIQNDALQGFDCYLQRDRYGLSYLDRTEKNHIVLQKLCESGKYEFIIVDNPDLSCDTGFDRLYFVRNDKDQRSRFCNEIAAGENQGEVTEIINRSVSSGWDEGRLKIPDDRESFASCQTGIQIAMDGYYAMNIGKVCREWI